MPSLKHYIQKLYNKHWKAREQLIPLYSSLSSLKAIKTNEVCCEDGDSVELTIQSTTELINEVQSEFDLSAVALRKDVDKTFSEEFSINPKKVDCNAIILINSDILSDEELFELAKEYKNNVTMALVISRKLNSGNPNAQALGNAILKGIKYNKHFELFDNAVLACKQDLEAIQKGNNKSFYLDEIEKIMSAAEEITIDKKGGKQ